MTDDELLALIDVVQFAYRMYSIGASSLRSGGDVERAEQMEIKAETAMLLSEKLIIDGDPSYPGLGEIV